MLRTRDTGSVSLVSVKREPVEGYGASVSFVKDWARIDGNLEDSLIESVVSEVIDLAEEEIRTLFSIQKVTAIYDSFAAQTKLPFGPVVDVLSVERLDVDQSHDIENWYIRGDYLYFDKVYGYEHPYYRQGLEVEFLAGFIEMPKGLQLAIRQSFLTEYEDRQDNVLGSADRIYSNSRKKFLKYKRY
jgi:hypothetical protein